MTSPKYLDATDFGRELEVTCHNYFGTHKVEALASEMAGRTTGATNARLEKSPVSGPSSPALRTPRTSPLPPKLTTEGIVNPAADELKSFDGAITAGTRLHRARRRPRPRGPRLRAQGLGLKFDSFSMKTLLDHFDEANDGMIPMQTFPTASSALNGHATAPPKPRSAVRPPARRRDGRGAAPAADAPPCRTGRRRTTTRVGLISIDRPGASRRKGWPQRRRRRPLTGGVTVCSRRPSHTVPPTSADDPTRLHLLRCASPPGV